MNLDGGGLLGGSVLEMVDVVVIEVVEILTRRLKLKLKTNPHRERREQQDIVI